MFRPIPSQPVAYVDAPFLVVFLSAVLAAGVVSYVVYLTCFRFIPVHIMLKVENLVTSYGMIEALKGVMLEVPQGKITALLEKMLERFPKLKERTKQLAGTFSGGEQQMLAIARALMARPRIFLMDEPSIGLAPMKILSDDLLFIVGIDFRFCRG